MQESSLNVQKLESEIEEMIRKWGTDHCKYTRVALKKVHLKFNAMAMSFHGAQLTYLFSVLFYGSRCNSINQRNIHVFRHKGKYCWASFIPDFTIISEAPENIPVTIEETDLADLIEGEIKAVRKENDRIIQEEYSWKICENVLQSIAKLANWSFGEGTAEMKTGGDICVSGADVKVLLYSDKEKAELICNLSQSHKDIVNQVTVKRGTPINADLADGYQISLALKKESPTVAFVKKLSEINHMTSP